MMFTFALLLLCARTRSGVTYRLSGYIFSVGYVWLYYGLYRATRLAAAPWLLYSDVIVTFLVGPLLYSYACAITGAPGIFGRSPEQRRLRVLHFAPALIALGYFIVLQPSRQVPPAALESINPYHFGLAGVDMLNKLVDACFFGYVLAASHTVVRAYRSGHTRFRRVFRGVVAYFVVGLLTFVGFLAGHLLRSAAVLGTAVLLNGLNTACYFFYSFRFPEHTQRPPHPTRPAARMAVVGSAVADAKILGGLQEAMEIDHEYRDPDLTLQALSTRLRIQHHRLSRILNRRLHTSFRSYINRYRLEEAKGLLLKRPKLTVLEIAFAVGFNSKSTFNAAFLKDTGRTPSDFRKANGVACPETPEPAGTG